LAKSSSIFVPNCFGASGEKRQANLVSKDEILKWKILKKTV